VNVLSMPNADTPDATPLRADPTEAIVRAAESALQVRRRYQFFVWSQSHLNQLIPHRLAVCGSYDRRARELVFDVFNSVSVEASLLNALADARSPLMQRLQGEWLDARCRPIVLDIAQTLQSASLQASREGLLDAGFGAVLVHGISRPDRPQEIESFFVFAAQRSDDLAPRAALLELLIPHMHAAWQRVQSVERDVSGTSLNLAPTIKPGGVTQREREILGWLREGKSNQQIADQLGISALTVKNHVQKILRKLNASNRAQAVAQAMSLQLLERPLAAPPRVQRARN
jgi:transcriptional regulator EpsA